MSNSTTGNETGPLGWLKDFLNMLRLAWRLLQDPRVPLSYKAIPFGALVYVVFPVDFIPDLIPGLGQLDDIAVILLGLNWFVSLCPPALVAEHRRALFGPDKAEEVVDAEYRVVGDQNKP